MLVSDHSIYVRRRRSKRNQVPFSTTFLALLSPLPGHSASKRPRVSISRVHLNLLAKYLKGIQSSWCTDLNALILNGQGWTGGPSAGVDHKMAQFVTATSDIVLLNLKQDEVTRHASQYKHMMETVCRTALERYDEGDL